MSETIFASAELVNKLVAVVKKAKKAGLSETEIADTFEAVREKLFAKG